MSKPVYFLDILEKARKEGRSTLTKEELQPFWGQLAEAANPSLNAIFERRRKAYQDMLNSSLVLD